MSAELFPEVENNSPDKSWPSDENERSKSPLTYCSSNYLYPTWEDVSDAGTESAISSWNITPSSNLSSYPKSSLTDYTKKYLAKQKMKRLKAGKEAMRESHFRTGITVKKPTDYGKQVDAPTNWGLYESKQKEWQQHEDLANPRTTYQEKFRWPTDGASETQQCPVGPQSSVQQLMQQPSQALSQEEAEQLIPKNITKRDWDSRGKQSQMLPIPWAPAEPRWPSELARAALLRPDEERQREINSRLARMTYEQHHPVEKWAANLYLH